MADAPKEKVREAKIVALRHQIATGTYETPDKMEAAIDAFLNDLEQDRIAPGEDRPKRPK